MRKLLIVFVLFALCSLAQAPQKPMLGELPDASQFDMPVGLWLLNEGIGGLVNDLSGNGNNGTLGGSGLVWQAGKFGPCIYNGGSGDLDFASSIVFAATEPWTVAFWVKKDSAGADHESYIITDGVAGDQNFIWLWHNNRIRWYNNAGSYISGEGSFDFESDWRFIVARTRANGLGVELFMDGVLLDSDTISTAYTIASYVDSSKSYPFEGWLGPLFIFDRRLTVSQMTQLCRDLFPWFARDPIELWAVEEAPAGQVIFINFASMGYGFSGFGLILVLAAIRKIRRTKWERKS